MAPRPVSGVWCWLVSLPRVGRPVRAWVEHRSWSRAVGLADAASTNPGPGLPPSWGWPGVGCGERCGGYRWLRGWHVVGS